MPGTVVLFYQQRITKNNIRKRKKSPIDSSLLAFWSSDFDPWQALVPLTGSWESLLVPLLTPSRASSSRSSKDQSGILSIHIIGWIHHNDFASQGIHHKRWNDFASQGHSAEHHQRYDATYRRHHHAVKETLRKIYGKYLDRFFEKSRTVHCPACHCFRFVRFPTMRPFSQWIYPPSPKW